MFSAKLVCFLRDAGWETVYLHEPLTDGLAPEGLKEYVTQRPRWCLSMMQIARSRVGPFERNRLRLRDRLSIIDALLYWVTTFPFRLATLIYPPFYWYFDVTVVDAKVADVIDYFGVFYLWILLAMALIARGLILPVLNDVSQILGAIPITRAAFSGLPQPKDHPFRVTAKGGDRSGVVFQWKLLAPYLILLALNAGGILVGILSDSFAFNDAGQGKHVILFWTLYNILVLALTILTSVELPRAEIHVADRPERVIFQTATGNHAIWMESLTLDTMQVSRQTFALGTVGSVDLAAVGKVCATVIASGRNGTRLRLQTTPDQKEALLLRFYADGDTPGIPAAKILAVFHGIAARLSESRVIGASRR